VKGIAAQPDVTAINKAGKIKKRENLISSLLLLEPVVNNENRQRTEAIFSLGKEIF